MTPPRPSMFRNVARLINPQLPLDTRQSTQLLTLLKTSFQNHLDAAHPPIVARGIPRKVVSPGTSVFCKSERLSPGEHNSIRPTTPVSGEELVSDVLSNPLFSTKPKPLSFIFGELTQYSDFSTVHKAKDWFNERLASGTLDFKLLERYLHALDQLVPPEQHGYDALALVTASQDVERWLPFESLFAMPGFWQSASLRSILIHFLVVESRQSTIRTMLVAALQHEAFSMDRKHHFSQRVVMSWLDSCLIMKKEAREIVQAFNALLKVACEALQAHVPSEALGIDGQLTWKTIRAMFAPTGNRIASIITAPSKSPNVEAHSLLLETVELWSRPASMGKAFLCLYHPTKPDAYAALSYMECIHVPKLRLANKEGRNRILKLCLDSALHLLSQNKPDIAASSKMLGYAETYFAEELFGTSAMLEQDAEISERVGLKDSAGPQHYAGFRSRYEFILDQLSRGLVAS